MQRVDEVHKRKLSHSLKYIHNRNAQTNKQTERRRIQIYI